MAFRVISLGVLALAGSSLVLADFQYQQTTKITGGSMLSMLRMVGKFSKQARQGLEPITQNVVVKGNRMAHIGKDSTDIIDLDAETFTRVDHAARQYSVTTFADLKKSMEAAAKEMDKRSGNKNSDAEVTFTGKVRDGNQAKQISGLNTRLTILTLQMNAQNKQSGEQGAMAVTADMWMAPEVPGYAEVREFNRRFAEKMGMILGPGLNPGMAGKGMMKGFADLAKEASKLNGVPVFQVTRMGATAEGQPLPSASEAPLPPSRDPQMPSAGEVASDAAANTAAGALGRVAGIRLGGFGRKKSQEPPPQQEQAPASSAQQQAAASVLMEMESTMSGFSSAGVDASQFAVPAGYKQVQENKR